MDVSSSHALSNPFTAPTALSGDKQKPQVERTELKPSQDVLQIEGSAAIDADRGPAGDTLHSNPQRQEDSSQSVARHDAGENGSPGCEGIDLVG
ncbi:MAG: hypothetical protein AAF483_02435 [Planctomycetota bacterium]